MKPHLSFPPLTPKHAEFLRKKAEPFVAKQPRLAELQGRLLALGGLEAVWLHYERYLDDQIDRGRVFPTSRRQRRFIADSQCHANVVSLWYESKGNTRIATGYALSDAGLWLPHSWGVEGGRIVEMTSGHWLCYYGVELAGEEALKFMFANASPDLMERFGRDLATGALFPELVETARAVVEEDRFQ